MIKTYEVAGLRNLSSKARSSERRRTHLNVHESLDASVQKLFIATEPDTYMRPHQHPQEHKWEFFIVLHGRIDLLIFSDNGALQQRVKLSSEDVQAVEIPPRVWHSYVCMQSGTVALEVKQGAYIPTGEGEFAPWAPQEGASQVPEYLEWLRTAQPEGDA